MLKFEHFWKCIPEMYPPGPFVISKYAAASETVHVSHTVYWFVISPN